LKETLYGVAQSLFGENVEARWLGDSFPFTHPSWQLEILYRGKWLEVLGCGIIQQRILQEAKVEDKIGWAFGIGLERIAMILFDIPDIRYFWSEVDWFFILKFKI
jgi:phenylalanyl-tRNA synthetase alpha chain